MDDIDKVYVYHNLIGFTREELNLLLTTKEQHKIDEISQKALKRLIYKVGIQNYILTSHDSIDEFLEYDIKNQKKPFDKKVKENFPFAVTIKNSKRYVLSLNNPLKTINNPDGTSIILEHVKTLIFEKDGTINYVNPPSSDFIHISLKKKKASPKAKKVSPKAKKASPKKKKASPKKKKASLKKKKASQKKKKSSR